MQATITIDKELLTKAQDFLGLRDTSAIVDKALTALIQQEASQRLALLGGTLPDLVTPPRRRFPPDDESE